MLSAARGSLRERNFYYLPVCSRALRSSFIFLTVNAYSVEAPTSPRSHRSAFSCFDQTQGSHFPSRWSLYHSYYSVTTFQWWKISHCASPTLAHIYIVNQTRPDRLYPSGIKKVSIDSSNLGNFLYHLYSVFRSLSASQFYDSFVHEKCSVVHCFAC